ncbi:hypothetical protein SLEP1_g29247 [Rubroshorea leprosula]|uniref:Uncharacterized protein n=1 Tax=Rubroshorea leprosula TaxID=152421 RepID=A0AAV5K4U5_9ROSI|nr:hypothetical protein SLEP1_g29247 [Rubroshorea leprosula]
MQMQMQPSPLLSFSPTSPSFNSYSSEEMAAIAARVAEEFRAESGHPEFNSFHEYCDAPIPRQESDASEANTFHDYCDTSIPHEEDSTTVSGIYGSERQEDGDDVEDEDFEFAFVCGEPESSSITADEIFYNGQIRPIYPLFDTSLLAGISCDSSEAKPRSRRPQLRKLLTEEREAGAAAAAAATVGSCSSSEAEEFEGLAPETYCVWTPKDRRSQESSPERCGKSNSTGTSKRWRLGQLMRRSNSDGKNTLVFLSPSRRDKGTGGGDHDGNGGDRDRNGGEKRKSILPEKQDFLGFFFNVNGLSRNLHPF